MGVRNLALALAAVVAGVTAGCTEKDSVIWDNDVTTTTTTTGDGTTTTGTSGTDTTSTTTSVPSNLLASNLQAFHAGGSSTEDQCLTCHGDKTDVATLDTSFPEPHKVHRDTQSMKCTDCHKSTDLTRNETGSKFIRQVDPSICAGCHRSGSIQWYE